MIALPILWVLLTSLYPASEVYYVHRGTHFTLWKYLDVLAKSELKRAFFNSGLIATLATLLSIQVTISSGFMLSRFQGLMASTWFGQIYLFHPVHRLGPAALRRGTELGGPGSYWGPLLPHMSVHICFFS